MKTTTVNSRKNIYSSNEMIEKIKVVLPQSVKSVLMENVGNHIQVETKKYDKGKFGFSTTNLYGYHNDQLALNRLNISLDVYKEIFESSSKKSKKKINKLLFKLESQPNNSFRLFRFLHLMEKLGNNENSYKLLNSKEAEIAKYRKAYKDIVKHIKMDLPTELKKAREKYKEVKGDFYKTYGNGVKKK